MCWGSELSVVWESNGGGRQNIWNRSSLNCSDNMHNEVNSVLHIWGIKGGECFFFRNSYTPKFLCEIKVHNVSFISRNVLEMTLRSSPPLRSFTTWNSIIVFLCQDKNISHMATKTRGQLITPAGTRQLVQYNNLLAHDAPCWFSVCPLISWHAHSSVLNLGDYTGMDPSEMTD